MLMENNFPTKLRKKVIKAREEELETYLAYTKEPRGKGVGGGCTAGWRQCLL